jgi:hypothetical protein
MNNRWFTGRTLTVAVLFGLSVIQPMAASTVQAHNPGASEKAPTCTLATLKGRYLFAHSGVNLPPAFGVKDPTPGADAGFHIFNGDGTGTDIVTVRVGTEIALKNAAIPFHCTVNADCTGSYAPEVPPGSGPPGPGPSFDLFIAPNGDEFAIISTAPPGNYVSGIDRRVSSK